MRWEDERYVRLYTRDTPEWLALSWQARGLFALLMRAVDRAGILKLGKLGLRGVAVAVRAPWDEIEEPLKELLDDGCVQVDADATVDVACVFLPNFLEAQECSQSDRARKRTSREKARAMLGGQSVTNRDQESRDVTNGHDESRSVTTGHERSQSVTPTQADPDPDPDPTHPPYPPRGEDGSKTETGGRPLPPSERAAWGPMWMEAYETAMSAELGRPWGFERRHLGALEQAIGKFCQDKTRIVEWVAKAAREFARATAEDDPKFWSGHSATGLLSWFNKGRPGYTAPEQRQPAAPPPPLEKPPLTPEQNAEQAAKVLSVMANFGKGGASGSR